MHPFDTLLEKAKVAHANWITATGHATEAMVELGDAIQEAEALKSIYANFDVLELRVFKGTSYIGDRQMMFVALDTDERGEPYLTIEIRTLTKTPEKYGYNAILRRINGYFYIRNSFGMRVCVWSAFFEAVNSMRKATTKATMDYLEKKEKTK